MLSEIYVKDFVLIDSVNLPFCEGMSAFTGETGAGKSLLIDAIGILCGDRVNTAMIKQGKEKAIIEGVFHLSSDHPAYALLEEAGYEIEEETMIVQRIFTIDGKSSAKLNHRTTTVSFLRKVLATLIDIHSQHDSQYLLNAKYHLQLLDHYCDQNELLIRVKEAYQAYSEIAKQLQEALQSDYNEDDLEYLTYQLNEIDEADIKENELQELEEEQRRFAAFEKISTALHQSLALLNGDSGANPSVYEAARLLEIIDEDEALVQAHDKLLELYYSLEDQYQILYQYMDTMEYDEQRVNEVNERIFLIHKILRKYGGDIDTLRQKRQELEQKIDQILHRSDYLKKQEALKKAAYDKFYDVSLQLHELRTVKAKELEEQIVQQLRDLHLANARFHVEMKQHEGNQYGIDQVQFLISMNKGEGLRPLQTTASGGELSRLMLGLKTIFSRLQGIETIIFDEIDTGVSGSVAFAIGKKMQQLSKDTQVFCVTHLSQVAACADHHYLVEKTQDEKGTVTVIRGLNEQERIEQLALIASDSTSEHALSAAQELFIKAQENR